jgi:hypothetical protein
MKKTVVKERNRSNKKAPIFPRALIFDLRKLTTT